MSFLLSQTSIFCNKDYFQRMSYSGEKTLELTAIQVNALFLFWHTLLKEEKHIGNHIEQELSFLVLTLLA